MSFINNASKNLIKSVFANSKINDNHEITTQNVFLLHQVLNHGLLEPRASVLPMSYADPEVGAVL